MIHNNESHATDLSSVKVVSRQSSVRSIKPKQMSVLDNVIFCAFLCLVGGIATASQGVVNARLGQFTGQGLSSVVVFSSGAVFSLIYWLIEIRGKPPANLTLIMAKAPWWSWIGGLLGAMFVIILILTIPKLGAGTATAIVVSAKIIWACIIDHFQMFGVPFRQYTVWRGLATAVLIGCVGIIAKF